MIYIENGQDKVEVTEELKNTIESIIDYALKEEEVNIDYEVSVIFVDNEEIKKINMENRGIDKETDVLSFPMLEYSEGKVFKEEYKEYKFSPIYLDDGKLVLGDIVLSLEKALDQSKEYGHSFLREACYLTVHSVLHLLGYDHMEEEEKLVMRKREEEILGKFQLTR